MVHCNQTKFDKPFRLHDRLVFTRRSLNEPWMSARVYP
ncbi:pyridoxine 5'-phosphate oxidase C-terminal domain-containing protein [Pollutimonas bauzanensis]